MCTPNQTSRTSEKEALALVDETSAHAAAASGGKPRVWPISVPHTAELTSGEFEIHSFPFNSRFNPLGPNFQTQIKHFKWRIGL